MKDKYVIDANVLFSAFISGKSVYTQVSEISCLASGAF